MAEGNHDRLVYRLAQMLIKLNQGEKLEPRDLACEFGVNLRTVQRDLNVRFAYLPIEKAGGRYFLHPGFLGKLALRDIDVFAGLAGVRGLFPSLSDDFLRDVFDTRVQSALLVKGHHYENLTGAEDAFREIERAIVARRHIDFDYDKAGTVKKYKSVAPFKLVNQKGIWYVACRDDGKMKTFAFGKIGKLVTCSSHFPPDPDFEQLIISDDGVWLAEKKQEIVLKISHSAAGYFKRRSLIANQVIEKELEDGGLIVSAKVGHPNQILPIVRYWIPHIKIVSPDGMQATMESELKTYVGLAQSKDAVT